MVVSSKKAGQAKLKTIQKFRRFTLEAAMSDTSQNPALDIRGLNVFYGASHALQGVDLVLPTGVMSVVGRNGMGKTTLCKAIMGLIPIATGSMALYGKPISKADPGSISRYGVGYVPQGRRLWK